MILDSGPAVAIEGLCPYIYRIYHAECGMVYVDCVPRSAGAWRCATRTPAGLLLLLALLLLRALLLLLEAWAADVRLLSRRWGWCVVQCGGHLLSGER